MASLNSASICFGEVLHKRTKPKKNAFRYPVFFLRIPMRSRNTDRTLLSKSGVGDNSFSWISFYDRDHGQGDLDALAWIENELKKSNINDVDGEIWLHTFPRILGYVFNPVSFWFCQNSEGQVKAVMAEVNNTFGDRHCYLLKPHQKKHIQYGESLIADKEFHVSPFFDVLGHYVFRFMRKETLANQTQNVSKIEYWQDNELLLSTSINGRELPLTKINMIKSIVKFPLLTFGVILKIHWQAIKLWYKGAKFYSRPTSTGSEIK